MSDNHINRKQERRGGTRMTGNIKRPAWKAKANLQTPNGCAVIVQRSYFAPLKVR